MGQAAATETAPTENAPQRSVSVHVVRVLKGSTRPLKVANTGCGADKSHEWAVSFFPILFNFVRTFSTEVYLSVTT